MLVRGADQSSGRDHLDTGQTFFSRVLPTIQVPVVEDLADHVRAIEGRIRYDPDSGGCNTGDRSPGRRVKRLGPVDVLILADTGTDNEKELQGLLVVKLQVDIVPNELLPDNCEALESAHSAGPSLPRI